MSKSKNVGSDNGRAKLNEKQVREIRMFFTDGMSMRSLSDAYKVTVRCIHYVVRRKTWKHVD